MIKWIIPVSIIGLIILGLQLKDYKYPSQIQKELIKEFNKELEQIKMTERFESYHDGEQWTVRDNYKQRLYLCANDIFTEELADLLNDLSNENKELKKQLESEHQQLENAILLERTRMGKNALKQFKETLR